MSFFTNFKNKNIQSQQTSKIRNHIKREKFLVGIETLAEIDLIGTKTMFLVRVIGSAVLIFLAKVTNLTVLIFLTESSMGWAAPSYDQFFNSVVASTMAGGSQ